MIEKIFLITFATFIIGTFLTIFMMIARQGLSGALLGGKVKKVLGKLTLETSTFSNITLRLLLLEKDNSIFHVLELNRKSFYFVGASHHIAPIQLTTEELSMINVAISEKAFPRNVSSFPIPISSENRFKEINCHGYSTSGEINYELNIIPHPNVISTGIVSLRFTNQILNEFKELIHSSLIETKRQTITQ